ncbi:MAG: TonB C-terminal domain-containing protein [Kiritimatiellales bacterium]|nr:TonB C-terminal domain-containing protein [Kiritimatiellales bacterium]
MRTGPNKTFWWVFGTHAGILFLLLVVPFLRGCFHKEPKETVMFVDLAAPAPAVPEPILPTIQPEPTPAKPETPTPAPKPKPEKPKWKPAPVVRQDKRITRKTTAPQPQPAVQPRPDLSKLKQTLNSAIDPDDAYYAVIQPRFYAVWQQPATAPYGTQATATIRVSSSGQVSYRALTAPSGNAVFDQSVQAALRAVNQLSAPPKSLVNRDILIYFVLD